MNSASAAALAFSILAFLLIRGYVFLSQLRAFAAGISVARNTDVSILTQGGIVSVTAEFSAPQTPLSVNVLDVPPAGSIVVQGSTAYSAECAEYKIRLPVMGTSVFGGIKISASDMFFKTEMPAAYARHPELTVYPSGIALTFMQTGYSTVADAIEERDRMAIIPGTDVRHYRPYASGDNIRNINWKLSAKFDELYVQLRADSTGNNPLLYLDLPADGADTDTIAKYTTAAASVLERLRRRDAYPVFIYSGADCLGVGSSDKEEDIYAYLGLAGTVRRETALFRHRHIYTILKEANEVPENEDAFSSRVRGLLRSAGGRYPTKFEKHFSRLSAEAGDISHIYAVSTGSGDISTLLYLIADAAAYRRSVIVILAGIRGTPYEKSVVASLFAAGAFDVEVMS
ncbi:MAG: DUF58 domain-containing protein [Methanocorpusculum sp.]|nr:DUF58 domain-containing protein [Methanocorpusculum sp.]